MAGSCQHWSRRTKKKLPAPRIEPTTSRSSVPPSTDCAKSLFGVPVWIKSLIKSCFIDSRNKQSSTCAVVHETKESSLQTSPTESSLAQSVERGTDDLEVVGSIPGTGNFSFALFLQCWQDPARIWQEKTNYRKTRMVCFRPYETDWPSIIYTAELCCRPSRKLLPSSNYKS